jgi:hypothetical protein
MCKARQEGMGRKMVTDTNFAPPSRPFWQTTLAKFLSVTVFLRRSQEGRFHRRSAGAGGFLSSYFSITFSICPAFF